MGAILFFVLGLPAGFFAERLMRRFTRLDDEVAEDGSSAAKRLPWQRDAWPARVRVFVAGCIPPLMALAGWRFDLLQAFAVSALIVALLICTVTDLLRYRVPNAVTYPGIILALVAAATMPGADLSNAFIAAIVGGGAFLLMSILTRGGMGLGDVKLAALIGAALGLPAAYQALFLGVFAAGIILIALLIVGVVGRKQAVPYAPFLAMAAVAMVFLHGAAFAPL
jgi:prepilin signal peptidase PulO-like enzyme (type II secretory pathway)